MLEWEGVGKRRGIVSHYFEVVNSLTATRRNGNFGTIEEAKGYMDRSIQHSIGER